MSSPSLGRRTGHKVSIEGVDVTKYIDQKLMSVQYTDNEEDETDDLQITIEDASYIWLTRYLNYIAEAEAEAAAGDGETTYATHTVVNGDTLGQLAAKYLGDGTRYMEIYELNKDILTSPHVIASGQVLKLPSEVPAETPIKKNKGLRIRAVFVRQNWNSDGRDRVLDSGDCALDDITCSGPPNVIKLKASSLPHDSAVSQTNKNQAWEAYYLSKIAQEIGARAGMEVMFECDTDPYYERVEQTETSDITFLSELCHNAGISLKVMGNKLILYDQIKYEAIKAVYTITRGSGYINYNLKTSQANTQYVSCTISYTDPVTQQTFSGTFTDPNAESEAQSLNINMKVGSNEEAEALAKKMLRFKNKFEVQCSFTYPGDPGMVTGVTVELKRWGLFDGKYIIKQAVHSLSSSGYTTKITLRNVLEGY